MAMDRFILDTFKESPEFHTIVKPDSLEVFKEHGYYWVRCEDMHYDANDPESTRVFSVHPSTAPATLVFEEV
jgi:hypothetical protein